MRRLIFCFDGSWNKLSNPEPTNVVLIAESVAPIDDDGNDQIVYYDEGVGTGKSDTVRGGAFGVGLVTNIREAYRFLIFNYKPGDEIFVFGFSRGAFTAMSFVGFLRTAGILNVSDAKQIDEAFRIYRSHQASVDDDPTEKRQFRAKYSPNVVIDEADRAWRTANNYDEAKQACVLEVKYLGVWDIVAALGLPSFLGPPVRWLMGLMYGFHDARLSKTAYKARHAVSIDERRAHFAPTLWSNVSDLNGTDAYSSEARYQQLWFPGDHGSVGGGGPERGLSSAALSWVLEGAVDCGLKVNFGPRSRIVNLAGDYRAPLHNTPLLSLFGRMKFQMVRTLTAKWRKGPEHVSSVSPPAIRRWLTAPGDLYERVAYRPKTLRAVESEIEKQRDTFVVDKIQAAIAMHLIKEDETLGSIANAYYGDAKLYNLIFDFNRDTLDDPDRIYPGRTIRIPPKPAPQSN